MGLLLRIVINAATIAVAAAIVPGIHLNGLGPALIAGLVLGIVNAIVRPILIILTLPLTLLTLGLFLFVLNAICLYLTSRLVPGFDITGFGAAFLGSLIVSAVSWILTAFVNDAGRWNRLR